MKDVELIRILVGDTEELLKDEEIEAFVSYNQIENEDEALVTNIPAAAADCAGALAALYSRQFNFAEDGQRFDLAQRASNYLALETSLRRRAGGVWA